MRAAEPRARLAFTEVDTGAKRRDRCATDGARVKESRPAAFNWHEARRRDLLLWLRRRV